MPTALDANDGRKPDVHVSHERLDFDVRDTRLERNVGEIQLDIAELYAESAAQRELQRIMAPFGRAVGEQLAGYSDAELELIAKFTESSTELLRSATR